MSNGTFYAYVVFLIISGVLLAVLAGLGLGQSRGARVVNGLFAAGFLTYGLYLLLVFDGGEVHIFFYAFIVPIIAVVRMIQARNARKAAASVPAAAWQTGYPAPGNAPNATGYPVPGQNAVGYPVPGPAAPGYAAPGYPAPGQAPVAPLPGAPSYQIGGQGTPGYPQQPGQPQQQAPYGHQAPYGQPAPQAPYGQPGYPQPPQAPFPPHNGSGQPPATDPTRGWS